MYVEVDTDLPSHPKSLRLASLLNDPRAWTRMISLWIWAMKYARHGDLSRLTDRELGMAMEYPVDADPKLIGTLRQHLIDSGFVTSTSKIHGWKDWNKYLTSKRDAMRRLRASVTGNRGSRDAMLPAVLTNGTERNGSEQNKNKGRVAAPPSCPDCESVLKPLRALTGRNFTSSNGSGLHSRHQEHGVPHCLRVVEIVGARLLANPKTRVFARPKTLFGAENFQDYMAEAQETRSWQESRALDRTEEELRKVREEIAQREARGEKVE